MINDAKRSLYVQSESVFQQDVVEPTPNPAADNMLELGAASLSFTAECQLLGASETFFDEMAAAMLTWPQMVLAAACEYFGVAGAISRSQNEFRARLHAAEQLARREIEEHGTDRPKGCIKIEFHRRKR